MTTTEQLILCNLMHNEKYSRRVIPYIQEEYFQSRIEKLVFSEIKTHTLKYKSLPSKETIKISLDSKDGITEKEFVDVSSLVDSLKKE